MRLEEAYRTLEEARARRQHGVEADFEFHLAIANATGNGFYIAALALLRTQICFGIQLARTLSLQRTGDSLVVVQSEHGTIFEAIRDGDPSAAQAAIRQHIEHACRRLFGPASLLRATAVSQPAASGTRGELA